MQGRREQRQPALSQRDHRGLVVGPVVKDSWGEVRTIRPRIELAALKLGGGRHILLVCRPILGLEVGHGCRGRGSPPAVHRGGVSPDGGGRLCITRLGDRAVVSPQNPVVIRPRSEPQPDLLVLRPRAVSYSRELPASQDVLLAVEVADTTVRFDRLVKARLYARAGIPEFWLCLAMDGAIEVYRGPGADAYASVTLHGPGANCRK